jgi:hypothetical protein
MWEFPQQYGLWSPAEITTAQWLDAADASTLTLSGSDVTGWADKSGNARNAVERSSLTRPVYSVTSFNSLPGLSFNGTDQNLIINNAGNLTQNIGALSLFCAVQPSAPSNSINRTFWSTSIGTGPEDRIGFTFTLDQKLRVGGRRLDSDSFASVSSSGSFNTSPAIAAFYRNWSAGNGSIFYNGNAGDPLDSSFGTSGNTSNTASQAVRLGSTSANLNFFQGIVSEVIVITGVPVQADRQRIEGYLAHKWGLTANLPSDHPYKTVGPTP